MKKNSIWILVFISALTLIGLIILQSFWLKNALSIKESRFNQDVNKSLGNVVQLLQNEETISQVIKEINSKEVDTIKENIDISLKNETPTLLNKEYNIARDFYLVSQNSQSHIKAQIQYVPGDTINTEKGSITWRTKTISDKDTINEGIGLKELYNKAVKNKTVLVESIVNKLISSNSNFYNKLDQKKLEKLINQKFDESGIELGFQYCVKDKLGNIVYKSDLFDDSCGTKLFTTRLFPDDLMLQPHYLLVYFPSQNKYLYHSLGFMTFSTVALTVIIFLVFSLTIYIIFKQKRLSEIKTDFVNNMTHELKTPISTISLASQMLSDKSIPLESKNVEHISQLIADESKRLGYLVERVLYMAVFDKGVLKLKIREIDLNTVIDNIIKNISIHLKGKDGKIVKEEIAQQALVYGDEMHITNAIVNLFDNAIKYCNEAPFIIVNTRNISKGIIVEIKDNGIGIAPEKLKHIFEQYYRVPTGNIHNVKGFGLGLSYVKRVTEEHQGKVTVESEPGRGSTFCLTFPNTIKNKN